MSLPDIITLLVSIASLIIAFSADRRARKAEEKSESAEAKAENYKKADLQIKEDIATCQKQISEMIRIESERKKTERDTPVLQIVVERTKSGRRVLITNVSEAIANNICLQTFGDESPREFSHFPVAKLGPGRQLELTYWLSMQSSDRFGAKVLWESVDGEVFSDDYEINLT